MLETTQWRSKRFNRERQKLNSEINATFHWIMIDEQLVEQKIKCTTFFNQELQYPDRTWKHRGTNGTYFVQCRVSKMLYLWFHHTKFRPKSNNETDENESIHTPFDKGAVKAAFIIRKISLFTGSDIPVREPAKQPSAPRFMYLFFFFIGDRRVHDENGVLIGSLLIWRTRRVPVHVSLMFASEPIIHSRFRQSTPRPAPLPAPWLGCISVANNSGPAIARYITQSQKINTH